MKAEKCTNCYILRIDNIIGKLAFKLTLCYKLFSYVPNQADFKMANI